MFVNSLEEPEKEKGRNFFFILKFYSTSTSTCIMSHCLSLYWMLFGSREEIHFFVYEKNRIILEIWCSGMSMGFTVRQAGVCLLVLFFLRSCRQCSKNFICTESLNIHKNPMRHVTNEETKTHWRVKCEGAYLLVFCYLYIYLFL